MEKLTGKFNAPKFRALMAEKNIRHEVLCRKLKKSRVTLHGWRYGISQPRWSDLKKLGDFFGIDYRELMA